MLVVILVLIGWGGFIFSMTLIGDDYTIVDSHPIFNKDNKEDEI